MRKQNNDIGKLRVVALGFYQMAHKAGVDLSAKQLNLFYSKGEVALLIKNYNKVTQLCGEMAKGCSVVYDAKVSAITYDARAI